MRRLLVLVVLLALATPTAAWAFRSAPGDETFVVTRADGYVALKIRGAVIGRTSGRIEIVDPKEGDCSAESVWGARFAPRESETRTGLPVCSYVGTNLRFRLVGGQQWVRIWGTEISVSAVGRGDVWMERDRDSNRGTYSLDGDRPLPLPVRLTRFTLGTPLTSPGSG